MRLAACAAVSTIHPVVPGRTHPPCALRQVATFHLAANPMTSPLVSGLRGRFQPEGDQTSLSANFVPVCGQCQELGHGGTDPSGLTQGSYRVTARLRRRLPEPTPYSYRSVTA
jgi:hypothetical protein